MGAESLNEKRDGKLHDMRKRGLTVLGMAVILAWLGGCTTGLSVDRSYQARGQDSRVRFIVLHYTSENTPESLRILTRQPVSAHYLITDEPVKIYGLVDENRRAWHAGTSDWFGYKDLNAMSIGVEIVNAGPLDAAGTRWAPYSAAQMQTLKRLLHDIQSRHHVRPWNIVAHSDIAPLRKTDPGPAFPWRDLARDGLGRWFDENAVAQRAPFVSPAQINDAGHVQDLLTRIGYPVQRSGIWDAQTRQVLRAFQMHYRPANVSGVADGESIAIAENLAQQLPVEDH